MVNFRRTACRHTRINSLFVFHSAYVHNFTRISCCHITRRTTTIVLHLSSMKWNDDVAGLDPIGSTRPLLCASCLCWTRVRSYSHAHFLSKIICCHITRRTTTIVLHYLSWMKCNNDVAGLEPIASTLLVWVVDSAAVALSYYSQA